MSKPLQIKRKPIIRLMITSAIASIAALIFVMTTISLTREYAAQNIASVELIKKESLINEMIRQIGYGHFIHNFKNLVIRRDKSYLEKAEIDYQEFLRLFDEYQSLETTELEITQLQQIQAVLQVYRSHLAVMEISDLESISITELDAIVRVDDGPASEALQNLYDFNRSEISEFLSVYQGQRDSFLYLTVFGIVLMVILLGYTGINYAGQVQILRTSAREKESRLFLEEVLNNTNSTVLVLGENGKIVEANKTVEELTGYARQEIIGLTVETLVPEKSRFRHDELRDRARKNRSSRDISDSRNLDLKLLQKNGEEVHVAISFSHISVNEKPLVVCVIHDISKEIQITNELKRSQKFLEQSQEVAKFSSWYWNIETGEVDWSQYANAIYGIDQDILGHSFNSIVQFVHPDDKDFVVDAIQTTVVLKSEFNITYRLVQDDGSIRFIKEEGKPFVDNSGDTVIIGTARDITEEHLRTELLKMADSVFSNSQDGIIVTDEQQRIRRINEAFTKITGYSEEDALGKTPRELLHSGRHDSHFFQRLWHSIHKHGEWSGQIWDKNSKGNNFLSQQFITLITDEQTQSQSYVAIIRDITEAHRNEELLRKRAYFDNLTKLPNRSLFQDRLSEKLAKVRRGESRFALCFADLDGFKQINDTHGHEAGDLVLAETASRMAVTVRESDTVARLAGDEFTMILDEVNDRDTALMVVNKIIEKINQPILFNDVPLHVGASFGVIIVNRESQDTIEELLSFADKAMYEAKQAGKNRAIVYHHPKLS